MARHIAIILVKLDENRLKGIEDIQSCFLSEAAGNGDSINAVHFQLISTTLIIICKNLELVEQVAGKLTTRAFHFTWKRRKRKQNLWGKDKTVLSPPPIHRIEDSFKFCDYL